MLDEIKQSIDDAQMVLVGIGAEMDAAAEGQDEAFLETLKAQAESNPAAAQLLTFMQARQKGARSRSELLAAYQRLAGLLEGKNYFVVSLCDDGLIDEAGLCADRIVTPRGNKAGDKDGTGEAEKAEKAEKAEEPENGETPAPAGYEEADWKRYMKWLQGILNKKLCILELGAGMEAPQVIRFAFEKVTFFNQKAYLYRVHSRFPQLTEELKGRGCSVAMHPADLLKE